MLIWAYFITMTSKNTITQKSEACNHFYSIFVSLTCPTSNLEASTIKIKDVRMNMTRQEKVQSPSRLQTMYPDLTVSYWKGLSRIPPPPPLQQRKDKLCNKYDWKKTFPNAKHWVLVAISKKASHTYDYNSQYFSKPRNYWTKKERHEVCFQKKNLSII